MSIPRLQIGIEICQRSSEKIRVFKYCNQGNSMTKREKEYWSTMIAAIAKDHVEVERQRVDEIKCRPFKEFWSKVPEVKGTLINVLI